MKDQITLVNVVMAVLVTVIALGAIYFGYQVLAGQWHSTAAL